MENYVVIVGAGPSGLVTALSLYQQGIKDVCVLTVGDINTHKACNGLLPPKAFERLQALGIDVVKELDYYKCEEINFYYRGKERFSGNHLFFYVPPSADRKLLDRYLYEKVQSLGIKIYEHTIITNVDIGGKKVFSTDNQWQYEYLIFADGVNGFSRKLFDYPEPQNIGMEAIIKENRPSDTKFINLEFGLIKNAYCWVGSTGEYATVGFAGRFDKSINYRAKLKELARRYGYEFDNKNLVGGFFPSEVRKLYHKDCFLVGDAAGLADPLSAEGLYYGFLSAYWVSQAIAAEEPKLYVRKMQPSVRRLRQAAFIRPIFYCFLVQWLFFWRRSKNDFRSYAFAKAMLNNEYGYFQLFRCYLSYRRYKKENAEQN